jgi:outer membrane protein assembly factor BamB
MHILRVGLLICLIASGAIPAARGDWAQWRGPDRSNVSTEKNLLKEWPEGGPPLRWRAEGIGEGIASVSVSGGRIYTVGSRDGSEFALALDQHTGARRWARNLGPVLIRESALMRWLSQRTPTVDGDRVYVFTGAGDLVCLRTADGAEVWRKSYPREFDAERPHWGFCEHPLVDGERLICAPATKDALLVALDKRTGAVLWKSVVPEAARQGYAAVVASEGGGLRQYVAFTGSAVVGVAAADGRLLWKYEGVSSRTANTHTPIPRGDLILCSNGYNTGIALLRLAREGEGIAVQEQYRTALQLDAFQDNTVWAGDLVYTGAGNGRLFCIDASTGKTLWGPHATVHRGRAALLWADDRLYLRFSAGGVGLAEVNATGFTQKGAFTLPEAEQAAGATAPVIAGGRLFLRDNNRLFCYDIREDALKSPPAPAPTISITLDDPGKPNAPPDREKVPDAVFAPTPQDVVEAMLQLAGPGKNEVVTDLGSGDGRIVITAAKRYGCKAVGYEIDPRLVAISRESVAREKLDQLVKIEQRDFFTVDLAGIDVVAVFLPPELLARLLPQFAKLKPGACIVSHQFAIPGVKPDRVLRVKSNEDGDEHTVYLWRAPLIKER